MGIEWWQTVVGVGVAAGLARMRWHDPTELRLNTLPHSPGLRVSLSGEPVTVADTLREAHRHCSKHRSELEHSEQCGCFYCERMFSPKEIVEWIDDGQTAMCPHCGIDAVIGSAAGFELTHEFLSKMNESWFAV